MASLISVQHLRGSTLPLGREILESREGPGQRGRPQFGLPEGQEGQEEPAHAPASGPGVRPFGE